MALDRGPWNALVDDDGSNLVGTIWNKDKIKTVILDPVDASLVAAPAPIVGPFRLGPPLAVVPVAGITHNWNPNGSAYVSWRFNPPAGAELTGIVAEPEGTQHLLINGSGNTVKFWNYDSGSLAANRIIGPGFAHYILGSWASAWIIYQSNSWIIQRA